MSNFSARCPMAKKLFNLLLVVLGNLEAIRGAARLRDEAALDIGPAHVTQDWRRLFDGTTD